MIPLHQEYLLRKSIHITGKDHIPESVHIYIYTYIAKDPVRTYSREEHYCMISLHQEYVPPEKKQAYIMH